MTTNRTNDTETSSGLFAAAAQPGNGKSVNDDHKDTNDLKRPAVPLKSTVDQKAWRKYRNAKEKERSIRIAGKIDELQYLLARGGVTLPKGTKTGVLTEAARYIRRIQQEQEFQQVQQEYPVRQQQQQQQQWMLPPPPALPLNDAATIVRAATAAPATTMTRGMSSTSSENLASSSLPQFPMLSKEVVFRHGQQATAKGFAADIQVEAPTNDPKKPAACGANVQQATKDTSESDCDSTASIGFNARLYKAIFRSSPIPAVRKGAVPCIHRATLSRPVMMSPERIVCSLTLCTVHYIHTHTHTLSLSLCVCVCACVTLFVCFQFIGHRVLGRGVVGRQRSLLCLIGTV